MNRTLIAAAIVFILGHPAESQSAIKGRVTDTEGAAIAKARVLIHFDPAGRSSEAARNETQDVSVVTDSSGVYSITAPAGFYDVFVSAPSFTPFAAKVIVKQHDQANFNPKLRVDPQVSKQIGGMEVQGVAPKP
jgi:Carboxypeptidase regulatory-like domain